METSELVKSITRFVQSSEHATICTYECLLLPEMESISSFTADVNEGDVDRQRHYFHLFLLCSLKRIDN